MSKWLYYGISNGIGVLFCLLFCVFAFIKHKNSDYKQKLAPLKFLYIMLIILEIIKIVYHITFTGSYPAQRYPIVFCSLVMFTYPIICHTKQDSMTSRISYAISVIPCLFIGSAYLFFGFSDVSSANTYSFVMNLHSRFYHFSMLAGAIYIIAVKLYDFRFKDFYFTGITVGFYFILCTVLSIFIGGNLSYFGPTSAPPQIIYNTLGYVVGNIFLFIASFLLSVMSFAVINLFKKIKTRKS